MRSLPFGRYVERRPDSIGNDEPPPLNNNNRAVRRGIIVIALLATALLVLLPSSRAAAAGAAPITLSFDHLSTGFELDGVHRDLPCESCHLNAVFKGTPRKLRHLPHHGFGLSTRRRRRRRTSRARNNCAACHNTIAFRPDVHFDHREVMGSCVSCHNGTIAQGKGPTHPADQRRLRRLPHGAELESAQDGGSHADPAGSRRVSASSATTARSATGQNKGHLVTTLECGDCHLTTTWLGANFDHTGIKTGCFSCHNGVKAVGKQGNHMPTVEFVRDLPYHRHRHGGAELGTVAVRPYADVGADLRHLPQRHGQDQHRFRVRISPPITYRWCRPPRIAAFATATRRPRRPGRCWPPASRRCTPACRSPIASCAMPGRPSQGCRRRTSRCRSAGISPTKKAPLVPPHIPILAGTDCSACHGAAYTAGGFGPATAMSAAKHAFVSDDLRHLPRHGQEFLRGQRHAAAAAARQPRQQYRPAHGHRRLFAVPRRPPTGTAMRCRPGTCRIRAI